MNKGCKNDCLNRRIFTNRSDEHNTRNTAISRPNHRTALPVTQRNAVKRYSGFGDRRATAWHPPTAPWLTSTDGSRLPWTGSRWWSGRGRAPRSSPRCACQRSRTTKWPSCSERSGVTRAKEKLWTCSPWMRTLCAGARYSLPNSLSLFSTSHFTRLFGVVKLLLLLNIHELASTSTTLFDLPDVEVLSWC